jgi:hypothetical protein
VTTDLASWRSPVVVAEALWGGDEKRRKDEKKRERASVRYFEDIML